MTPTTPPQCTHCKKKVDSATPGDFLSCLFCDSRVHSACLLLPLKTASTKIVPLIFNSPWFAYRCSHCQNSGTDTAKTDKTVHSHTLHAAVSQLETLAASLTNLVETALPKPSSYAEAASKGTRPPGPTGLANALLSAERTKSEEEKRLRSAVLSGLPESPGQSDLESVQTLLAEAGVSGGVEVVEVFRMGRIGSSRDADDAAAPRAGHSAAKPDVDRPQHRKLKIVTKSPQQLATLLSKDVVSLLRNSPPQGLENVYLNPSRTSSERRYLALLRVRRNLLNATIDHPDSDGWFIDNRRSVLVRRIDGRPDWVGPGDVGLVEWIREEESKPEPRRPRQSLSQTDNRKSQMGSQTGNR